MLARKHVFLLVIASTLFVHAQETPEEKKLYAIASRFVPPAMAKASAKSPHELPLRMAVAKGKLNASGKMCLVAVYANSLDGGIRVLVPRGHGSYRIGGEAARVGMVGDFANVQLKDVDSDGFQEIVASFEGLRGPISVWILKWNGEKLVDLTPLTEDDGVMTSALTDALFEDLDGDGKLELISSDPYNPAEPSDVYRFQKGAFRKTGTLVFWQRFVGRLRAGIQTFEVTHPDIEYVMTVVNGDERGDHRVTDGSVLVNGDLIALAADIATRPLTTMVHLRPSNEIEVTIKDPRQTLFVSIAPAPAGPPALH